MWQLIRYPFWRYIVAVFAVALASLLAERLNFWADMAQTPWLLFLGAVMLSAWWGGLGSGLLATGLGAVISRYPNNPLYTFGFTDWAQWGLFVLQGASVSVLWEAFDKVRRQADLSLRSLQASEAALQSKSQQITNILESTTDAVVMLDRQWRFTYINHCSEKLLRYPRESLLGRSVWQVFPELVDSVFYQQFHKAVNQQIAVNVEAPSPASGRWMQARAYPSACGLAIYFQDITERRQTEQAIQSLNRELERRVTELQTLLDVLPVGIAIADDPACKVLRINPFLQEMLKIPSDASTLTGATATDYLCKFLQDGEELALAELPMHAAVAQGIEIRDTEIQLIRSDGASFDLLGHTLPLFDEQKQVRGCMGVYIDFTERKRVETALRQSEARFRRIFESNMLGINFARCDGKIVLANQAFLDLIGYTQEDIHQGLKWQDITPLEYRVLDEQAAVEIHQKGVCTPFEKEYIRKDGSRIPVLVGAAMLDDPEEGGICFVLDSRDRKHLENQLRQQAADLERANCAKDEFLAILSHELRTPLNSILGWSRLLRSRKFDLQTCDRALEVIERNAELQTQLVDDLLDMTRLLQGKLHLKMRPVNLITALEAALETLRPIAHDKEIHLRVTLEDSSLSETSQSIKSFELDGQPLNLKCKIQDTKYRIRGDISRLQQVVWNLLSNAVKFTPRGGGVEIQLLTTEEFALLRVIDTGIGIPIEFLPFVFDSFRQADSTNARNFGGLGLGLAIASQLVELHGGSIQAESAGEGQGAAFTVKLPLLQHSVLESPSALHDRKASSPSG